MRNVIDGYDIVIRGEGSKFDSCPRHICVSLLVLRYQCVVSPQIAHVNRVSLVNQTQTSLVGFEARRKIDTCSEVLITCE